MRIAVVGSGIAGLTTAWLLARRHAVTLFEATNSLGGHAHTVDVELEATSHPVDTGFLVFNHNTYPNLRALLRLLDVPTAASDMSFSVSFSEPDIEWAGHDLRSVFAQRSNLVRPKFWKMLADMARFNRDATLMATPRDVNTSSNLSASRQTLGQFLKHGRYGRAFQEWYLLPMAGAIWSCPTATMLDYPMSTFARFCANHGLLQWTNRPQWHTVRGGSREYVQRMARALTDIRLSTPVKKVRRSGAGMQVLTDAGPEQFDQVVLACHSDQALRLIESPSPAEQSVLSRLRYQANQAILHTDIALLPRRAATWASWNYIAGAPSTDNFSVGVTYLLNRLQPLPFSQPVMVTLNAPRPIDPSKILRRFDYEHPIFDTAAIAAQGELAAIQGQRGLWFCGAWAGFGFHEDGLKAGLAVANALGEYAPWQQHTGTATEAIDVERAVVDVAALPA